jgi:GxxExxY protein
MITHAAIPDNVEKCATACVDAAMTVHRNLGPGFKHPIYQRAFCLELDSRGIKFECEKPIKVRYREWEIPGQRVDLLVEGLVLVEIKTIPKIRKIHHSQVVSYLKTMELRLGLIMNFNTRWLKDGLKRIVR